MDQALTTLRIAWRRRALFGQPLAIPLALAALFTLVQPDFNMTVIDLATAGLGPVSLAVVVGARVLLVLPYLVLEAIAVGMIVALVAEGASTARWLPNGPALRLAAVACVAAVAAYALLVAAGRLMQEWMGTMAQEELTAREPLLRSMLFIVEVVDWGWAAAAIAAIVAARRIFASASKNVPPPGLGRFAAAALLVLVASTALSLVQHALLTQIFLVMGDAPLLIGQIADAVLTVAAMAVTVPVIAVAIAVAAFAGRTAARERSS